MQVFFVVDGDKDLDEKIELIENSFNTDIRFFVKTELYTKICTNAKIINRLVGVYETNATKKIDEYIKSNKYQADNLILYYSSAKLTSEMVKVMIKKLKYNYDSIYFTKYRTGFMKFLAKIYVKICGFMFGCKDSLCYHKFQYMSKDFLEFLVRTKFNNHIQEVENGSKIELEEKDIIETMKEKIKIKSYNFYNLIFLLCVIVAFIVCSQLFKLRFFMYLAFVLFIILSLLVGVMLIVHNIFESRYKRK